MLKKAALIYVGVGAGVAAWAFLKGYTLDLQTVALWPGRFGQIQSAPKYTATPRAQLVFN
jgi:hypothetical protein